MAEIADLIGVPETTLRTNLARTPISEHLGTRHGRRVSLSCHDAFFYFLVNELTEYGVPVRTAMHAAADVARQAATELPRERHLVIRSNGGVSEFQLTNDRPADDRPALVLPIRALAETLIEDAALVHATDEAAP